MGEIHLKAENSPDCVTTSCGSTIGEPGCSAIVGVLSKDEITCLECRKALGRGGFAADKSTNPDLTAIFIRHFRGKFFRMPGARQDIVDYICNPWWWPRGPARMRSDWGLPHCDRFVAESLLGCREGIPINYPYCGFLGSVRAQ